MSPLSPSLGVGALLHSCCSQVCLCLECLLSHGGYYVSESIVISFGVSHKTLLTCCLYLYILIPNLLPLLTTLISLSANSIASLYHLCFALTLPVTCAFLVSFLSLHQKAWRTNIGWVTSALRPWALQSSGPLKAGPTLKIQCHNFYFNKLRNKSLKI